MLKRLSPESLASACSTRPLIVVAIWLGLAVISVLIAGALLDSATTTELRLTGNVESERAKRLLEDRLGSRANY